MSGKATQASYGNSSVQAYCDKMVITCINAASAFAVAHRVLNSLRTAKTEERDGASGMAVLVVDRGPQCRQHLSAAC
eukprot:16431958-Heterocapsa_arctica.AAC.1